MRGAVIAGVAMVMMAVQAAPASAQASAVECAAAPVSARGEPARFEAVARAKARANWRARVRAMPGLGNSYSNWARAAQAVERCISGSAGTVCTLTGRPCR